jgi:flagellar biosynthesis/type III secretory pathway chaperone
MKDKLKEILSSESKALNVLLSSLDEQFLALTGNEVFKLEVIVEKIDSNCRQIAKYEVERRNLLGDKEVGLVIQELGDKQLDLDYRNIKKLIAKLQVQKETNDMLIRQGFAFSTKVLNILNPDRTPKTYNSFGKRR